MLNKEPAPSKKEAVPAVLTQDEWNELHDALELALDALGDGPQDVDVPYLVNSMIHQRIALRLTYRRARDSGEHSGWSLLA